MAEVAQPLVVTNPGQPIVVSIKPAYDPERAQGLSIGDIAATSINVSIQPAKD